MIEFDASCPWLSSSQMLLASLSLLGLLLLPRVHGAFSFNHTAPTQCDDLQVSWTGYSSSASEVVLFLIILRPGGSGSGYYLTIIPVRALNTSVRCVQNSNFPRSSTCRGIFRSQLHPSWTAKVRLSQCFLTPCLKRAQARSRFHSPSM